MGQDTVTEDLQIDTNVHGSDAQNVSELGEADHAEESIDGMGAIRFPSESDRGFFGIPPSAILSSENVVDQARAFFQYRLHALHIPSSGQGKFEENSNRQWAHVTRTKARVHGECI